MNQETKRYGITLSGITRIFSKTKEFKSGKKTYSITDYWCNVSEKQEDGSYISKSISLMFPRKMAEVGAVPKSNTTISFNAFPVLTGENQYTRVAYMVTDWQPETIEQFKHTEDEIPVAE